MKKLILLFIGVLLLYSANVYAQGTSMTIGTVSAGAGVTVDLPINVANFNNVGAVSLKISYDASSLTFVGIANSPANVTFTTNATGGNVMLSWFDQTTKTPINITNGKLLDLMFTSNGSASSVNFVTSGINPCAIGDELGNNLTVTYNNGGVTGGSAINLSLANVTASAGSNVSVALSTQSLVNVGAISLKIDYNPSVLTFTGITNAIAGVTFTAAANNGVISISWFDQTAKNPINISNLTNLLSINFTYINGTSALTFDTANCNVSNELGTQYFNNTYSNGSVQGSSTSLQLGNITTAAGAVSVPLTVSGFNNVGSVSLKIDYNASSLSFSSVTTTLSGVSFTAAASNGVLSISWFDQSGKTPIPITSGTLLTLNFTFNGVASSLAFDTVNSEISNDSGVKINGITYSNGSIQGSVSNPTVTLVNTPGAIDSVVSVPLTVQNFSNIGAISLKIAYNSSALSFVSISNAPAGRNFTASAANGILSISWFDQSTDTPMNFANQTLLDVNFKYNGGNGSLSFNTTSCQISNESGVALTNVVYVNGAVSSAGPAITIANVISPIGTVIVPVTVTKMSGIGAISLVIDYNASLLTNATLINPYSGLTFTSNAKNGEFLVSWFDQSGGNAPFNADSAVLFDLSFNYTGGTDPLSFDLTQSQFATGTGTILNNVTFNNGSVKLGSAPTLSLPNATAVLNNSVSIPVSFKQFKAIGAISLKIQYNASVLNFTGITNVPGGKTFTYNESNGIITLSWFDQTGGNSSITADSATLVNLNFVYLGGSTSLTFLGSASQVADSAGDVIAGVVFINGSVSVINSVITHSGIPKVYALSQNYPNPFNPSTNINFDLPKESKVVLKVYNILGQEVATLVNRAMVAGSYTFQFTDKNLSSGIYIYRLQAGDFTLTKKMTLLK